MIREDRRVIFAGDSFVAGVGDPEGRGWVGRVVGAAFAAGLPLTAYNLGVRRETSAQIAARLPREAAVRLLPEADCRLVVSAGANDALLEHGRPRLAAAGSRRALEAILGWARELGLPALVVGPPPVGDVDADAALAALCPALAAVCDAHGVGYVPTHAPLRADPGWAAEAAAGDGSHPGAGGYAALAELVLAAGWLEWLARRPV